MITSDKWKKLQTKLLALNIREADIEESFVLGSGSGGQKINKTHSCVRLKHTPTGLEVKCQKTRFREDNRYFARRILASKMEEMILGKQSEEQQKIAKLRRQKKRRSRRTKEKILADKHKTAQTKALRRKVNTNDD